MTKRILPTLKSAVVCQTAAVDPRSGQKSLVGVYSYLNAVTYPFVVALTVYFVLNDGEGEYDLEITLVHRKSELIAMLWRHKVLMRHRQFPVDGVTRPTRVQFAEAGLYELRFTIDGAVIGAADLVAVTRPAERTQ